MSNLTRPKRSFKSFIGSMLVFSLIAGMFAFMIPMTQAQAEGRTFTVGFDAEFPPYGYKDNSGEYVGFDLDLAQEVCSRNGWTLRKQPIVWDTKDSELNSGSIDCIWNGFTINGREDKYTWSDAYVDNSQVVIVRKDSEIKKLSDLAGKTVLVQADSSALAAFQGEDATDENKQLASSFKTLRQSADYNTAFMELESGMADAVCLDYGVANFQLGSRGESFRMLDEKVSTEQYGIGFKLGNTELRDQVQAALYAMKKDGKFDEIVKKWGLQDSVILQVPDSGEGSKEPQTSKTDDDSEKGRRFVLGFDAEFPPYGYKDNSGEYVGFDLDLAQEVCTRRGWTLIKQPIVWDTKDSELNSGAIDCIWNGFTINGREDKYTWSDAYVDNSQVVVVRKDSEIKKLSDLAGKTVLVQADSSALAAFQGDDATDENKALAASFKTLRQAADYNSSFLELESGMADAVCLDYGVANYQLSSRGDTFRMLDEKVSTEQYGIGFKLGNTELRDKVQQTLYEMKSDGKFDEIAKKWGLQDSVVLKAPDKKAEDESGKKFVVGFDAEFPPYGYKNDQGEYVGFDLDLAQEVCTRRGWTLIKQPIVWDTKDSELNSGSIDCIWNGFTINGREDKYTWSTPYVDNSQVVVVAKDSPIKSLDELKDKIVLVQADSSALAAFKGDDATKENKALAESFKSLRQTADYNTCFLELESGMADAVCLDYGVANYQLRSRGDSFRMLEEKVSTEKYGIGFKLGNKELRNKVQETLLEMKADGTFDRIAEKWGLADSVCLSAEDKYIDKTEQTILPGQGSEGVDWGSMFRQLGEGMSKTLLIFFLTLLFAMPLGLLVSFVRMSRFKVLQWIARIYISIMRGTPLMLQLLVVGFAPYYVFGIRQDESYRFIAVIIGFSLNYAAYFAEIYRAGIQAVPKGQREAASVLGYTGGQTFRKIIFPQMVKNVLPPVTNEIITLVKDTSLASVLTYLEMFTIAKQLSASYTNLIPLFVAGAFYYVFNFLVAFIMEMIEKKLSYYK